MQKFFHAIFELVNLDETNPQILLKISIILARVAVKHNKVINTVIVTSSLFKKFLNFLYFENQENLQANFETLGQAVYLSLISFSQFLK